MPFPKESLHLLPKDIYDALLANLSRQIKQKQVAQDGAIVKTADRFTNHRVTLLGLPHN